ncbi:MAG TPA: DUF4058 family protein, partial [Isosphaeraceae bacterium]|nr:DUF4058 family protein [Isosphaeraceae bacterium]
MPIHDWTSVSAGIFHDFHHGWISELSRLLNGGLLPTGYYALIEPTVGGLEPGILALETAIPGPPRPAPMDDEGISLAARPPRVRFHAKAEENLYARKAKVVVVRHTSGHRVVAMVELVSPGNKGSRSAISSFVRKAQDMLATGVHFLIVDLFPPGTRDPEGIHRLIWEDEREGDFALPADAPLTCVSYIGGPGPEVFLEPVAVGGKLPEMPLFLTPRSTSPSPSRRPIRPPGTPSPPTGATFSLRPTPAETLRAGETRR